VHVKGRDLKVAESWSGELLVAPSHLFEVVHVRHLALLSKVVGATAFGPSDHTRI
jgi:hypothetical protein